MNIISARQINKETESELHNGTSFFGATIKTTLSKLRNKFGIETYNDNNGTDKVNIEFDLVLELTPNLSIPFTLYDWKEYKKIGEDEEIVFHIGARNKAESDIAKFYIDKIFNKDFSENGIKFDTDTDYIYYNEMIQNLYNQSVRFEKDMKEDIAVYYNFIPSKIIKDEFNI